MFHAFDTKFTITNFGQEDFPGKINMNRLLKKRLQFLIGNRSNKTNKNKRKKNRHF